MKEVLQLVSGVVAVAASPEVALAAVVGWFGRVFWERRLSRRRKLGKSKFIREETSNDETQKEVGDTQEKRGHREAVPVPSGIVESGFSVRPLAGEEVETVEETISPDEVSPGRLVEEIVAPVLRELSNLAKGIREKNMTCGESILWNGARRDGTTWFHDEYAFDGFPKELPQPSVFVEVTISVHIKSTQIPPDSEILEWKGYFRSEKSRIYGVWNKFPTASPKEDSIPAYNLDSLMSYIQADIDAVTQRLQQDPLED